MFLIILVIAKIRHLQDYQLRLSYNMMPCPSGLDIANCLKYFSQVLLSKLETLQYNILKTTPSHHEFFLRSSLIIYCVTLKLNI